MIALAWLNCGRENKVSLGYDLTRLRTSASMLSMFKVFLATLAEAALAAFLILNWEAVERFFQWP